MPFAQIAGNRLHYQLEGAPEAPVLVLSNSIGIGLEMWAPQVQALAPHLRVLRYDTRGHGASSSDQRATSIDDLSDDVAALLDHLDIPSAHFCGLSLGGLTGQAFALRHPQRLQRLVLCNTSARIGSREGWSKRIDQVREVGLARLAATVVPNIWLRPEWALAHPASCQVMVDLVGRSDLQGYIDCCQILRETDLSRSIQAIRAQTWVISGRHDLAATLEQGQALQQSIAGARFSDFECAHLVNWECTSAFNQQLLAFLSAP